MVTNADDWKDTINETMQTPDGPVHYNKMCVLCARQARVPSTWNIDDRSSDDEPDNDSAQTPSERLSAAENDSDSEADALTIQETDIAQ